MTKTIQLQNSLLLLAEVFEGDAASPYRNSFEEFMREHEFGLALHSVCDYLILEGHELITPSHLTLIMELHAAMQIQDDCLPELERARARKADAP